MYKPEEIFSDADYARRVCVLTSFNEPLFFERELTPLGIAVIGLAGARLPTSSSLVRIDVAKLNKLIDWN